MSILSAMPRGKPTDFGGKTTIRLTTRDKEYADKLIEAGWGMDRTAVIRYALRFTVEAKVEAKAEVA